MEITIGQEVFFRSGLRARSFEQDLILISSIKNQ